MRPATALACALALTVVALSLVGALVAYKHGRAKEAELERQAGDEAETEVQHQVDWLQRQMDAKVKAIPVPGFLRERRDPTGDDANALIAEPGPRGGR